MTVGLAGSSSHTAKELGQCEELTVARREALPRRTEKARRQGLQARLHSGC